MSASSDHELPAPLQSNDVALDRFAQRLEDEIARRQALVPVEHSTVHPDISWGAAAADEWLLVECEVSGCTAGTTVDVPADPAHDVQPVRAVLDDRGWSLDAQGRDLCPQHRRGRD